jgi:hypothetical protein
MFAETVCTLGRSYSESHRRCADQGDRQKGWWLSLPLGIINGRVAGRQVAEQYLSLKDAIVESGIICIFVLVYS